MRESGCQLCGLMGPRTDRECRVVGSLPLEDWESIAVGVVAEAGHGRTRACSMQAAFRSLLIQLRMDLGGRALLLSMGQALGLTPSAVKTGRAAPALSGEFSVSLLALTGLRGLLCARAFL